jgi:hypothetical protein
VYLQKLGLNACAFDAVLNSMMCIILHIQIFANAFLCILGNMPSQQGFAWAINWGLKTNMRTPCE